MPSQAKMDALRQVMARKIAEHGWCVQSVLADPESDEPPFSYSIGMTETLGHPELLMIGFPHRLMQGLINDIGALIRGGQKFEDWSRSDEVIQNFPVWFREVPLPVARKWARAASERYRPRPFRLLQVFLPDAAGKFPWDADCEPRTARVQGVLLEHMRKQTN